MLKIIYITAIMGLITACGQATSSDVAGGKNGNGHMHVHNLDLKLLECKEQKDGSVDIVAKIIYDRQIIITTKEDITPDRIRAEALAYCAALRAGAGGIDVSVQVKTERFEIREEAILILIRDLPI